MSLMQRCWAVLSAILVLSVAAAAQSSAAPAKGALDAAHTVSVDQLVQQLKSGAKPVILNVGPRLLYAQAHIPGAEYIGGTSTSGGMFALRARATHIAKDKDIVLYCGCCPWEHCPNVEPGFTELKNLGFTNVKVLYLPNNFDKDWVQKGYPTVSGQ